MKHPVTKKFLLSFLVCLMSCAYTTACRAVSHIDIYDLRCEFMTAPLAIDNSSPHLSWKMSSKDNGVQPSAYQILVASEPSKLKPQSADLWDSGKQPYPMLNNVKYQGKELCSQTHVYWKVRVWDENGKPSKWSEVSTFGIGLLNDSDWVDGASFIGIEQNIENEHTAPLLRKRFEYKSNKERVLLYVNSLGYHEAYINGQAVSSSVLNPAVSQYEKRSLINTYDVTDMLKQGENELVIWSGIGWYHKSVPGVVAGGPYVRAQMDAISGKEIRNILVTDQTWKVADSGRYNLGDDWTKGERVDQRKLIIDLSSESLNKLTWSEAKIAEVPTHKASAQMCEPNIFYETYKPVAVHKISDDSYVYDMGHTLVGFIEIKMPIVEEGKAITLIYDDFYHKDPKEVRDLLQFADTYIGNGKNEGVFENKFQYKAFRYLKINGLTQPLDPSAITGRAITTDFDGDSTFECSDKDMNDIHNMIHKTVKALSLGGYMVDCPHIERLGYGGDGNASTPTFHTMYNVAPLYMNWLLAWADSQKADGDMPHTAPNPNFAGGGPFWCEFIIIASWHAYVNYGDSRMIEQFYPNMQRWIEFAERHKVDGVLKKWEEDKPYRWWYLGDWATPTGIDQTDPRSIEIVSNCVLSESYMTMAKIAKVLGKNSDAEMYSQKHKEQNNVIHKTFFNAETNGYSTETQTDLVYPMFVGATPPSYISRVESTLKRLTADRFKGHLSTGLVGVPIITQWATREGEAEFMYKMLKKREYPGYLYMIDNGTDFTWEHWNGARSWVHNCYNGIGSWFYQSLAGITTDQELPGYRHIIIRPQVVDGIDWVKASKDTPYGRLTVNWEKLSDKFVLEVSVPVGSSATLYLPDNSKVEVSSGAHRIESAL